MCVRACVRMYVRAYVRAHTRMCVCVCVGACVCPRARAPVYVCVCVSASYDTRHCILEEEENIALSTGLLSIVWFHLGEKTSWHYKSKA